MMTVLFATSLLLSSCYSYTSVVGKGAQGNQQITQWNHYLLSGLAPVGVSDSKQIADGAENIVSSRGYLLLTDWFLH
tara:strand:- start:134 stop:364 length:231 start_codon:yes stop_codon:yes gene_type:complete